MKKSEAVKPKKIFAKFGTFIKNLTQCTLLMQHTVLAPIIYRVNYIGANISGGYFDTLDSTINITLPAVDSNVLVHVTPRNVFASSSIIRAPIVLDSDEIMSSSILNTTSSFLNLDVINQTCSLMVMCDINPSSAANYCEVIVGSVTGSATIMDDMATVTISSLKCEGTYSITAGGTFDHTLEGSRFHRETVTTGECPEMSSTMKRSKPTSTLTATPTATSYVTRSIPTSTLTATPTATSSDCF
ncbi:uncharacterized protein [Dysidea avara]|uniref:uncharacterized protein n=1 Tax=Dysidea avara TaxID=196820 RepID=UPI003329C4D9